MVLLLAAALLGGSITFVTLIPYGIFPALAGAPFGGSLLALVAGFVLAILRTRSGRCA
jgi:hypothetical protein